MRADSDKPLIFVVIAVLVVALIFSSSTFELNARNMTPYTCGPRSGGTIGTVECCAMDLDTAITWCTTCDATNPPSNCSPAEQQYLTKGGGVFEAHPLPPSNTTLPQDGGGVFEATPLPPSDPAIPPGSGGTFETQQAPICPQGQVLDEQSGLCVLEEPEVAEEQPQVPEEEQQQSEP